MGEGPFSDEEIERSRRYHRPGYRLLALDAAAGLAVVAAFAFSPLGGVIGALQRHLPWPAGAPAAAAVVLAASFAVRLPLAYAGGYRRERAWGFSTQSPAAWLRDRLISAAVGLALGGLVFLGLVALARALPDAWPLAAAPAAAVVVAFLTFVAPVVLEPLFNQFRPVPDAALAEDLRALAAEAGVPVRAVLVADASRRTRKENAYVSGLGATRRVVVFDTLLERASRREIRAVAAHELGHRRLRHVARSTLFAMAGAAGFVVLAWAALRWPSLRRAASVSAAGAGEPRSVPLVLFLAEVLQLVVVPAASAASRRLEAAADRFALDLTADPTGFAEVMRTLALANLSDLDPPRAVRLLLFSHPGPRERIESAGAWAARHGAAFTPPAPIPPTTP